MNKARITKIFRFEAAHHLPHHFGKCQRPHGHSYVLEVTFSGSVKQTPGESDDGMVLDFYHLNALVLHELINKLDHQDLNEVMPAELQPTTAENLVQWMYDTLWEALDRIYPDRTFTLWRMKLWETANAYAEVGLGV